VKDERVRDERVLVYSTDGTLPLPQPGDTIRVAREKRRNSALTVVHGLAATEVDAIAKELRRLCGTGGTAKNGIVELQGDHRERVLAYFAERGRRAKRAGG
jgi:translation initiation factor 1